MKKSIDQFEYPFDVIIKLFAKAYDELALYIIGISFVLLFMIDPMIQVDFTEFIKNSKDGRIYLILPVLFLGLVYSIGHVFTDSEKSESQKSLMIYFAMTLHLFMALFGMYYSLETEEVSVFFPLINLIYAFIIYKVDSDYIELFTVTDRNAKWFETLIATVLTFGSVVVCYYLLGLYWIETMSISIIIGNQISGFTHKLGYKLILLRS